MLAIKAEIVSELVDVDTPCECIARKINRNTRDSLICDNSSSSICKSFWLISFRYLLPLNVFVSQSMSGRLKSPATHMVDLGYFRHNDFMVLYRALA
jgi:hypothetical protein